MGSGRCDGGISQDRGWGCDWLCDGRAAASRGEHGAGEREDEWWWWWCSVRGCEALSSSSPMRDFISCLSYLFTIIDSEYCVVNNGLLLHEDEMGRRRLADCTLLVTATASLSPCIALMYIVIVKA